MHLLQWTLIKKKTEAKKDLYYYAEHEKELFEKLKDKYKKLEALSVHSTEYSNFVTWAKSEGIKIFSEKSYVIKKITQLKMSEPLKEFLLQNYIEKIQIHESAISGDFDKGPNAEHLSRVSTSNQLADFRRPSPTARFVYKDIQVERNVQSWDFGEMKGERDPISGNYYSRYLYNLNNYRVTHGMSQTGWHDDDADHDFKAHKVKVTFIDKVTNKEDYFFIYINTAQDTDGANEDYTFMAIEPSSTSNILINAEGHKVPGIFGLPLDIKEMNLEAVAKGLKIDSPYIASYHEVDYGEDNEDGNCLDDIPGAPTLNVREGSRSLMHIGRDITNYVYMTLNSQVKQFDQIDQNFLYMKNQTGGFDYYYDKDVNDRVRLSGYDHKELHYDNPFDDTTDIYWSNQKVLDHTTKLIMDYFQENKGLLQDIAFGGDAAIGGLYTTAGWAIKRLDELSGITSHLTALSVSLNYSSSFIAGNLVQTLTTLATIDWKNKDSIEQAFTNLGLSIPVGLVGSLMGAAVETTLLSTSAITSQALLSSFLGPAGFVGGLILSTILNFVPTANGQSAMSNLTDHGMNDWNYQMQHNYRNLATIASNWSRNYRNGIHWTVEDEWNHMPKLFIATQDENGKDISGTKTQIHGFNNGGNLPIVKPNI